MAHVLKVLTPSHGHKTLEWNPLDEASKIVAQKEFEQTVGAGTHFATRIDAGQETLIRNFEEDAPQIIIAPRPIGG